MVARRSSVEPVTDYLRKKQREAIAEAYQRGYGKHPADSDLDGWADQGSWPDE